MSLTLQLAGSPAAKRCFVSKRQNPNPKKRSRYLGRFLKLRPQKKNPQDAGSVIC